MWIPACNSPFEAQEWQEPTWLDLLSGIRVDDEGGVIAAIDLDVVRSIGIDSPLDAGIDLVGLRRP